MGIIAKFKKLGPRIFIKKLLGFEPVFACAFREKGAKALYDGEVQRPFHLVPIDKNSWYADPLLFEQDGHTYLFMESWGYRSRKGVIVCCEIDGTSASVPRIVIEEDYHISFPNVFSFQSGLYMIPEVEESGGIDLYHCLKFPYDWEKFTHIDTKVPIIDTVIEAIDKDTIYLKASSFDASNDLKTCFWNYQLKFKAGTVEYVDDNDDISHEMSYENRNAGRYIEINPSEGKHCVQRSTRSIYGYSLKFMDCLRQGFRWEDQPERVCEIPPNIIRVSNWKKNIIGTHTYSATSKYEVVDIEYFRWSPMNWVRQIIKR